MALALNALLSDQALTKQFVRCWSIVQFLSALQHALHLTLRQHSSHSSLLNKQGARNSSSVLMHASSLTFLRRLPRHRQPAAARLQDVCNSTPGQPARSLLCNLDAFFRQAVTSPAGARSHRLASLHSAAGAVCGCRPPRGPHLTTVETSRRSRPRRLARPRGFLRPGARHHRPLRTGGAPRRPRSSVITRRLLAAAVCVATAASFSPLVGRTRPAPPRRPAAPAPAASSPGYPPSGSSPSLPGWASRPPPCGCRWRRRRPLPPGKRRTHSRALAPLRLPSNHAPRGLDDPPARTLMVSFPRRRGGGPSALGAIGRRRVYLAGAPPSLPDRRPFPRRRAPHPFTPPPLGRPRRARHGGRGPPGAVPLRSAHGEPRLGAGLRRLPGHRPPGRRAPSLRRPLRAHSQNLHGSAWSSLRASAVDFEKEDDLRLILTASRRFPPGPAGVFLVFDRPSPLGRRSSRNAPRTAGKGASSIGDDSDHDGSAASGEAARFFTVLAGASVAVYWCAFACCHRERSLHACPPCHPMR